MFAGGADTQCSLLGAGAVEPGDVAAILGTTTPVQAVVAEPLLDPAANLWAGCHVVPDRWVIESNAGSTGDAYLWLLDLLVHTDGDRHARAEELASANPDSGTFTFIGPRIFDLNELRPDMPGGLLFRFPTLQLRPSAGDLLRAFFESVAYAVRANLAQIEAVTGRPTTRLIVGGGMSRNDLLMQLVADVSGLPLSPRTRAGEHGPRLRDAGGEWRRRLSRCRRRRAGDVPAQRRRATPERSGADRARLTPSGASSTRA